MVYLNSVKLKECIDIEKITKDTVTLNVDGEKLIRQIYEDLKIELDDDGPIQVLKFQDAPFIEIYPNAIFNKEACHQLAIETMHRLNSQIRTQLNIKD